MVCPRPQVVPTATARATTETREKVFISHLIGIDGPVRPVAGNTGEGTRLPEFRGFTLQATVGRLCEASDTRFAMRREFTNRS